MMVQWWYQVHGQGCFSSPGFFSFPFFITIYRNCNRMFMFGFGRLIGNGGEEEEEFM